MSDSYTPNTFRPKYLPREFTNIFITILYIPPFSDKAAAANRIKTINTLVANKSQALQIILGDMNRCDLKLPSFVQQVTCKTRRHETLAQMHCKVPGYKCSKAAPLGNSGNNMVYITPKYRRKLKANCPTEKTIASQPEKTFDMLNTCFDLTNWNVFTPNSENIEEITEIVNGYIKFNKERILENKSNKSI